MCCVTTFNNAGQWQLGNRDKTRLKPVISDGGGSGQIPGTGACGVTSLAHRIFGGDDTQLDDYPWLALLEYKARKCSNHHVILFASMEYQKCRFRLVQERIKNCINFK